MLSVFSTLLFIYPHLFLATPLSIYFSFNLSSHSYTFLPVYLPICLSIYPLNALFSLSICSLDFVLFFFLFFWSFLLLFIHLSICLPLLLRFYLYVSSFPFFLMFPFLPVHLPAFPLGSPCPPISLFNFFFATNCCCAFRASSQIFSHSLSTPPTVNINRFPNCFHRFFNQSFFFHHLYLHLYQVISIKDPYDLLPPSDGPKKGFVDPFKLISYVCVLSAPSSPSIYSPNVCTITKGWLHDAASTSTLVFPIDFCIDAVRRNVHCYTGGYKIKTIQ